jgi:heme exporter protein B
MKAFAAIVLRDLRLTLLRGAEAAVTAFFFLVVASFFPFLLGGEAALTARAAPGIIWVAALLASLLSLDAVYHRDIDDGTADLLLLSPVAPVTVAAAKMAAHWISSALLLLPMAAVAALMLGMPALALCALLPSLALGTLYLSLLGGFGAALTAGGRRSGLLLAVLVLPLFVPMLVLGALAAEAALAAMPFRAYLLLQAALALAALPLAPLAAAACLNMNVRSS